VIGRFLEQVGRARAGAAKFSRPYWILISGEAIQSIGYGMTFPFVALYLTDTVRASAGEAGAVLAVWGVVSVAGQPLGGVLADRVGRRPMIVLGLAASAFAALGFGLAANAWVAALLAVFWGIGTGVFEPAAGALVADTTPEGVRNEAFGIWRVVNNAGFTLGPPLTALVASLSSFRGAFFVAGATLLAYLAIALRALPETRPAPASGEPPARFREALHDRLLVALVLGSAVAAFVYALFESALPVFLHEERGLSIATWGVVFTINPLIVAVFQYPISRWVARRSSRLVLGIGALLLGASLALVWPFASIAVLVAAIVLFTVGEMLEFPTASAVAADLAPERLRGSYQGALNLAFDGAWGPAALAGLWLVGAGHGELLLALALPLGALGALLFLALPPGRVRRPPSLVAPEPIRP
jgi:MFS family permease